MDFRQKILTTSLGSGLWIRQDPCNSQGCIDTVLMISVGARYCFTYRALLIHNRNFQYLSCLICRYSRNLP
ncbi:Protein of unknown function [Pyronema omphalodes CBS 100304]|uniref:Uncharacterized protein n=1 Tax=Pyronema omphalodes (strain CBS 100304) TaxID=1076935 RepID=U4L1A3_PYROM|nr:Protein of unknown function [Pyronema omphalodes CBS 100304]